MGEIIEGVHSELSVIRDFYPAAPAFVLQVCRIWRLNTSFVEEATAHIKLQLRHIGESQFDNIDVGTNEQAYLLILSGLLGKLRQKAAQECLSELERTLHVGKEKLEPLIQEDFSIIPNLWYAFEMFKIRGVVAPLYLLDSEILRLKLNLWAGS